MFETMWCYSMTSETKPCAYGSFGVSAICGLVFKSLYSVCWYQAMLWWNIKLSQDWFRQSSIALCSLYIAKKIARWVVFFNLCAEKEITLNLSICIFMCNPNYLINLLLWIKYPWLLIASNFPPFMISNISIRGLLSSNYIIRWYSYILRLSNP